MMSKILSRDDILKIDDLPIKKVEVPQWGGSVYVRGLTAEARDALDAAYADAKKSGVPVNIRARYAAACIGDKNGRPIFTEDDIERLATKSADALDKIYDAIVEQSKLSPAHVEEAAKN